MTLIEAALASLAALSNRIEALESRVDRLESQAGENHDSLAFLEKIFEDHLSQFSPDEQDRLVRAALATSDQTLPGAEEP